MSWTRRDEEAPLLGGPTASLKRPVITNTVNTALHRAFLLQNLPHLQRGSSTAGLSLKKPGLRCLRLLTLSKAGTCWER